MKIRIAALTVLLLFVGNITGQINQAKEEYPKQTISLQPFYLFNGGLRLEYERQLRSPREWVQINITGYHITSDSDFENYYSTDMSVSNSNFDDINKVRGFGIGGGYKYFLTKMPEYHWNGLKPYVNANLSYTHFNVHHPTWGYTPFKENGLTFYEYGYINKLSKFDRLNTSVNFGFQSSLFNLFYYDMFVGMGYSYSFYKKEDKAFTEGIYSYGYRGLQFNAGARIGVCF